MSLFSGHLRFRLDIVAEKRRSNHQDQEMAASVKIDRTRAGIQLSDGITPTPDEPVMQGGRILLYIGLDLESGQMVGQTESNEYVIIDASRATIAGD